MAMRLASLDVAPDFKAGDPPPEGYLAWHEWAETQHKAGLRAELLALATRHGEQVPMIYFAGIAIDEPIEREG